MIELRENEMKQITGGGLSLGTIIGIGSFITFLIGLVDGYIRPLTCRW